jgi:hypothetical protein
MVIQFHQIKFKSELIHQNVKYGEKNYDERIKTQYN